MYFIVSCSLYVDDEQPDIFFEYTDFDILELGGTYSDMIITADGHFIFLADYNNNRILKINTGNTKAFLQTLENSSTMSKIT